MLALLWQAPSADAFLARVCQTSSVSELHLMGSEAQQATSDIGGNSTPDNMNNSESASPQETDMQAGRHLRQDEGCEDAAIEGLMEAEEQVGGDRKLGDVDGAHSDPLGSVHTKGHWQ